jgi:hypothetical protein
MELSKKTSNRKYIVDSNAFLCENDVSFYLLGAYMTDGNINDKKHHISFSISSKDIDWIELIRSIISPIKPIYISKRSEHYTFTVSDIDAMNWLISYGCTPRKSYNLELRKDIPIQYHRDFIRGLIDGDGCISYAPYDKIKNGKTYHYMKTSMYLCSVSKIFLDTIKSMIPDTINCAVYNLGMHDSMIQGKIIHSTCDIYRLQFNDSNAKKLLQWLYYLDHKISMPRKNQKAQSIMAPSLGSAPRTSKLTASHSTS